MQIAGKNRSDEVGVHYQSMTLILVLVVAIGVPLFLLLLWARRARRRAIDEANAELAGRRVLLHSSACSFGQQSRGRAQIRGNGILACTDTELWFRMFAPARTTSIPLDTIFEITTTRSHLGKGCIRPMLLVRFRTTDGDDAVAWALPDLDRWLDTLQRVTAGEQIGS